MFEGWDGGDVNSPPPAPSRSPPEEGAAKRRSKKLLPVVDSPKVDDYLKALDSTFFFSSLAVGAVDGSSPIKPHLNIPTITELQVAASKSPREAGSIKEPELVRASYMIAAAEAEAEEGQDEIRRLQAERDQLRVAEQRLVSEKAALEEEMRVMRRELEAAKRERDDAIGERFVLQKELSQSKPATPQKPRGDQVKDQRDLEMELIEAKLQLAEALGRTDELEKEKRELESQVVEIKYELARQRSSNEDSSTELDRLAHENEMLRREMAKLTSKTRQLKEQLPPSPSSTASPQRSSPRKGLGLLSQFHRKGEGSTDSPAGSDDTSPNRWL